VPEGTRGAPCLPNDNFRLKFQAKIFRAAE